MPGRSVESSTWPRLGTREALAVTVGGLAAYDVLRAAVLPDGIHLATNLAAAGALGLLAAAAGLTARELGLSRDKAGAGLRFGLLALVVVTIVVAIGVVLPWTEGAFEDERLDVGAWEMAYRVLIRIPLGTVLLEELAFRGVLLALLCRLARTPVAVAWSAVLFGLWHVPSLLAEADTSVAAVVGTLAATTAAGVVFAALRLRSGSLLAPAIAHCATNSVTFALAWLAR